MNKKQQLLCTFTPPTSLSLTVDYIKTYYSIYNNKIFLYREGDCQSKPSSLLLIYNIDQNLRQEGLAKNTISIHRKKYTNTFYTINALNLLIEKINNGVLDKNLEIDWENYTDKLMVVNDSRLKVVDICFEKILHL